MNMTYTLPDFLERDMQC